MTGKQVGLGVTAAALANLKERQKMLRRENFNLLDTMETVDDAAYEALGRHLAELNRPIAETGTSPRLHLGSGHATSYRCGR